MTTETEIPFIFRRSKSTKKMTALGPYDALIVGGVIQVSRIDGSTVLKRITSISAPFVIDTSGLRYAYAHLEYLDVCPSCRDAGVPPDGSTMCPICALYDLGLLG